MRVQQCEMLSALFVLASLCYSLALMLLERGCVCVCVCLYVYVCICMLLCTYVCITYMLTTTTTTTTTINQLSFHSVPVVLTLDRDKTNKHKYT